MSALANADGIGGPAAFLYVEKDLFGLDFVIIYYDSTKMMAAAAGVVESVRGLGVALLLSSYTAAATLSITATVAKRLIENSSHKICAT